MVYLRENVIFYGLPKKHGDFPWFFSMFSPDLGSATRPPPGPRSVLSRLGRLLWMEAIDGSPQGR